jgi:hypothetical protein
LGEKEMTENTKMSKEELKQARKDAKNLLKKPFYKKVWFWALVVIVIIIAANSGDETTPVDTASDSDEEKVEASTETKTEPKAEPKAEPKVEEKVAGIGEAITVGGVEFTVHGTKTAENVGGQYGQNAQGTYLILDVTVKNVGNEAITTDSSFFQLKSGEKTFDADGTAGIYANPDTNFFLEQVNPDLSAKGFVVFDVSDEVIANTELMLQVQTGFFGTETGAIKVGK